MLIDRSINFKLNFSLLASILGLACIGGFSLAALFQRNGQQQNISALLEQQNALTKMNSDLNNGRLLFTRVIFLKHVKLRGELLALSEDYSLSFQRFRSIAQQQNSLTDISLAEEVTPILEKLRDQTVRIVTLSRNNKTQDAIDNFVSGALKSMNEVRLFVDDALYDKERRIDAEKIAIAETKIFIGNLLLGLIVVVGIGLYFLKQMLMQQISQPIARLRERSIELTEKYRIVHADSDSDSALKHKNELMLFAASFSHMENALDKYVTELMEQKQILENANRFKTEFLANMSHELRTPLNSIIGFSKRLLKRLKDDLDERSYDAIEIIHSNGRHLLDLVDGILDLSKIDAGKLELKLEITNILVLCESACRDIRSMADDKGLALVINEPEKTPKANVDALRIKQCVLNLLSNGIKFTREGTISINLHYEGENESQELHIAISDTGTGIKQEEQEKMFQKFTQLESHSSGELKGTGLGLPITSELVALHGGRVEVKSKPSHGSTFTIILPVGPLEVSQ